MCICPQFQNSQRQCKLTHSQCTALKTSSLAEQVFYPSNSDYHTSLSTFWRSDIQQTYPACIVQPRNAADVSLTLSTLVESNDNTPRCQFSIRSGGHGTVLGSTNRDYGVTVDLSLLSSTVYNPEVGTASIGPGARWKGVYSALAGYGVAVPGGRGGTVGVGGFVTGGGNSFHSARYGFTCDAVVNFEVCLVCLSTVSPPIQDFRPTNRPSTT
jgi:FAD/FMN-containing dehydrogenase